MNALQSSFCPVKIWSSLVNRVLSYPKTNINSSVNIYRSGRSYNYINSATMRSNLRNTVKIIGTDILGINESDIGTHSIRTTFAMLLCLNKIPLEKTMKLGRWKSLAVLEYIRSNINDFSEGISACIANASNGNFYTLSQFINSIE